MTDFAEIGILLDSRPVTEGTAALDKLAETSGRVEQKVGALNGQMNDTSAIMRKNAEAAGIASEAAKQFQARLEREIALFGASRAETERYNAAAAGMSAATQRQAEALGARIDALHRDEAAAREVAAAQDASTKAGERFVQNLKDQVAVLGMNTQQLHSYRASQLGVSEAATPLIAKLAEAGAGAHTASSHIDGLSFASVGAKRELLVLAHELSQGNYQKFGGSMMVLGEQTGAAGLLFSAAGLAALGLAAAVGGVAFAMIKGALEQKHMNDALVMTGNYAGLTSDSLNGLAHAAVAVGGSIGEAKKVATELAGSGKFTGDQISYITEATVAWEHATGQSVKSIIKDFESLAVQTTGNNMRATEAISRATIKLDDQYHFLTESIYEQIRALEKEGDAKGASALATETFAKATHDRAEEIVHNLGTIARGWNGVKEAIGGAIDSMGDWGKKATPASEVARLTAALKEPNMLPGVYNGETRNAAVAQATQQLAKAQEDLNTANAKATAQAASSLAQSEAVHAASRIAADDVKLQKRGMSELQVALSQYADDVAKVKTANPASALVTDDVVAAHVAAITKAHTANVKGNDDRAKTLQDALVLEQTGLDREKSIYDARDKMLTLYHSKFDTSDADFYAGREAARAEYVASEAIAFAKESALVQGYKPKNAEEVAANKAKYDELVKQHLKFVDDMRNVGGDDRSNADASVKKQYDDYSKAIATAGDAEIKSLDAAIAKQRQHNAEIGKSKEQIELAKQAQTEAGTARLQAEDDAIRALLTQVSLQGILIGKDREIYSERLAYLDRIIAKRKEEAGLLAVGANLEAGEKAQKDAITASQKLADMAIQDWQRAGASIADSLSKAFGSGGKAIGEMFKAYYDNTAKQGRLDKEMALAKAKLDTDPTKLKVIDDIQRQSAQAQLKSYADMSDAAQGFFDAGSRGYEAMGAAAKVMHAAEVALSLVKGVNAVLTQGEGDPYSAFARMAAMGALVAGLGVAISGGSGSGGGKSAADVQKAQGTGSVFGDSTAKSDSIARSIALASTNSSIELTHTAGMLAALKNIEASMSGLTNLIARTNGVTDAGNMGIQTGTLSQGPGGFAGTIANTLSKVPLIGGLIGGLSNLWGKTTQNVVDSGLQFGGSVRSLQSGQGYNQYASVDTTKSSWFGLSKSTSNSVQTQGLSSELSSQFGLIFTNLEGALKTAAVGIGGNAADVSKALDGLTIDTTKISLKGLSGDALTQALNGVISKTMDQMAEAAFPAFDSFRKVGEGYAETVIRVATDYANLDSVLQSAGMTFGAVGVSSIAAREKLIDMAGGIDKLAGKSTSFAENFLTQAERLAPVTKYVDEQMRALGLSSVKTRDQFKAVVTGLDLTTSGGQENYVALMDLADAFAKTHAAAVDLTKSQQEIADERKGLQDQLDQLTMSSTQLLTKQRNALDASNRGLFDQIQAAQKLKDAQDAAKTSLGDTITKMKSFADATKAYGSGLVIGSLSTLTPMQQYAEMRKQLDANIVASKKGDTAAQGNYQSLATAFLTASQKINGSDSQYSSDFAGVLQTSDEMAKWAAGQVDVAQASLDALNAQVIGISDLNTTMQDVAQAVADLPAAFAAAPAVVMPAPVSYFSTLGTANTEALVAEVKALREEVKGLRADQQKQTGDSIVVAAQVQQDAAQTIVDGVGGAIARAAAENKSFELE